MSRHPVPFSWPLLALLGLALFSRPASAATRTVPVQYATIQAAITASANGDTVLISDGTYTGAGNVDLDFGGRNITVTSVNGPVSTIINCGGSSSTHHRGFILQSGETNAVISGLTVENGYETGGGAISIGDSSVTIQNCTITHNSADNGGGGVVFGNSNSDSYNSAATLTGCTITGNTTAYGGGGVDIEIHKVPSATGGPALTGCTITNCVITGNSGRDGGGIYSLNDGTVTTLTGCTISGNNGFGVGILNGSGTVTLSGCTISNNNTSQHSGGGISS